MAWIPHAVRERVRNSAGHRCGYCHAPQSLVLGPLEIEHIIPTGLDGSDDESNLWLACRMCNSAKSDHVSGIDPLTGQQVSLFNPRTDDWNSHFCWNETADEILGQSSVGRATIEVLQLNDAAMIGLRITWIYFDKFPPPEDRRVTA